MQNIDPCSVDLRVLDESEVEFYNSSGYICKPAFVPPQSLQRLNQAVEGLIENSRALNASDGIYDLETGHSADNPRLRRVAFLDDIDATFWEFASDSIVTDLAADLLGGDLTFRECIINFKWRGGGQEVRWHQDIPFYPHTNLSTAQFLIFLDEVGDDQGPLRVIPGSHRGPIYDHYDQQENWLGYIPQALLESVDFDSAVSLKGPAGTVTAHHCATLHSSAPNLSDRSRPALILGYNAEDARPYTAPAYPSSHHGQVVRGNPAKFARHDNVNLRLPPDWSGGYTSIFQHQKVSNNSQ